MSSPPKHSHCSCCCSLAAAGYSPLVQLPDGSILNAPHVAVQRPGKPLAKAAKVHSLAAGKVTLDLTHGFAKGQPIVYISTEASDPLAATLENVPFVPALSETPPAALIPLVAFTNGATGVENPQRQGLGSAIKDGLSPLNIAENSPESPAYSPLWAVELAKWVGPSPGPRQASVDEVAALSANGTVASFNPKDPSSNPRLAPSGIVVNCPIIATVVDNTVATGAPVAPAAVAAAAAGSKGGCTPSQLGYQCSYTTAAGVTIHHSRGGPTPNGCSPTASSKPSVAMMDPNPELLHFAVEGEAAKVGARGARSAWSHTRLLPGLLAKSSFLSSPSFLFCL